MSEAADDGEGDSEADEAHHSRLLGIKGPERSLLVSIDSSLPAEAYPHQQDSAATAAGEG